MVLSQHIQEQLMVVPAVRACLGTLEMRPGSRWGRGQIIDLI
jgi:hypothetical protein